MKDKSKQLFFVTIDDVEKRLIIKALLDLKESQINENKHYNFLDDLIVKFIDAKEVKGRFNRYAER